MASTAQVLGWALPPLLGAAIGYGTNDLAIRMLFRPYKAYTLFGRRVPFTPGMIPKEQARIAERVASTITTHLLTGDELAALSHRLVSEENIGALVDRLLDQGQAALEAPETRQAVAEHLAQAVKEALAAHDSRLLAYLGSRVELRQTLAGALAAMLAGGLPTGARTALREPAARMLHRYLDAEVERLAERALETIDMRALIVKNVNAFPPERVERIIYDISRRELRGIIYLGGLLGFLVGCIQVALAAILH